MRKNDKTVQRNKYNEHMRLPFTSYCASTNMETCFQTGMGNYLAGAKIFYLERHKFSLEKNDNDNLI